jgi:hypothetical protein
MAATNEEKRASKINNFIPVLKSSPAKSCHIVARIKIDKKPINVLTKVPLAALDFSM